MAASWKKLSTWDFMWSLVALSRGAGEKEDAADLVLSLSSCEETVTLPWNSDTFLAVEVNYSGKRLVQLAIRKCGILIKLDRTSGDIGNEPSFTTVLLHSLVDHLGISLVSIEPFGNREIGWNFQEFESWNIQWGQKNTTLLRTPEWKQPKDAGRWLARLFFLNSQ